MENRQKTNYIESNETHQKKQNYFQEQDFIPQPKLHKTGSQQVEILSISDKASDNELEQQDLEQFLNMREKLNKSDGRASVVSEHRFNGNPAINTFKNSIASLNIEKNQDQDQDQDFIDYDCQEIEINQESPPKSQAGYSDSQDVSVPDKFSVKTLKNEEENMNEKLKKELYPPPEDFYRSKISVKHECINYGLNMYFKKHHDFSDDPEQAGGDLAPNQSCQSQPWGLAGCPSNKQENITDHVRKNMKDVVFCRYGMEYLKSFPRNDDLAIGSYRINLDYLIFQKQRHLDAENNASLVGMSFLKTKGQVEMNRINSPEKRGLGVGGNMITPFYRPEEQDSLYFDSVFESGNLAIAMKVSETEYNLLLQNDINTNGHTQWFYFKVKSNFLKKTTVRLNIINLYKAKSLYQYGMRVLALDVSDSEDKTKPKWERSGENIKYIQNNFTNEQCPNGLFQIEFDYEFDQGAKEIYFAHSMPYTYTMLNEFLNKNVTKYKAKRQTLCHSLAGNKVEYLYITSKNKKPDQQAVNTENEESSTARKNKEEAKNNQPFKRQKSLTKKTRNKNNEQPPKVEKQVILLTSRIHPGETNASWMMQGLLNTLLNPQTPEDQELVNNLKDHFEIYIIPMINVDGVINGNYRCSLAACDLNRKWLKPSKALHPSVYYTKKLCSQLMDNEKKQFFLYLDFHGHSAKKNIFQYGNKTENWVPSKQKPYHPHQPSVFPLMVSKQFDYFNFQDCTYGMPKSKESTARITMFHKLRIPFVFTLEASFAGANRGQLAGKHFSQGDFEKVGKHVLYAIWECKKLELNKNLMKQVMDEASKIAKVSNDDAEESDGCSSSEDDTALPTSSTKAMQIIQESDFSPSPTRKTEVDKEKDKDKDKEKEKEKEKEKDREIQKERPSAPQSPNTRAAKSGPTTVGPSYKSQKSTQNKSIINLKTINSGGVVSAGGVDTNSKSTSPRKSEIVRNQSFFRDTNSPIRRSVKLLDGGISESNITSSQISESYKNSDRDMRFDLIKNLIRAENPDDQEETHPSVQQEIFEQFNAQIEQSFSEQQQHLDEIFKQTAKQFLEQRQPNHSSFFSLSPSLNNKQNPNNGRKFTTPQSDKSNSQNWFLEQFLQQQKQNYQKNKSFNQQEQQSNAQIQTFLQLQKLHQMQKLNQMAQMQFFRQQAELLLSQNLTQQQQWEVFQQFSYYQAQIQMQNQQYQMMLSQSLHGNNMQMVKNQYEQQQQQEHHYRKKFQNPQERNHSPLKAAQQKFQKVYNTQQEDRENEENIDDYIPSSSNYTKKSRHSVQILEQELNEQQPPAPEQHQQQQTYYASSIDNQNIIKIKKGLIDFKQSSAHEHQQNFSQILNQQLLDQQQNKIPPVYQNKFFSTRGAGRMAKSKGAAKPQSRGFASTQLPQPGKVEFLLGSTDKHKKLSKPSSFFRSEYHQQPGVFPQSLSSPHHEAVIGKSKLNPVLHQSRRPGAPGTAVHQYTRSENLGINKSQDMKIRFKNPAHIANTEQSQMDQREPFSAPIAQNTRKTPSQFQQYPPNQIVASPTISKNILQNRSHRNKQKYSQDNITQQTFEISQNKSEYQ